MTLKELIADFIREDISFDLDIEFFVGPAKPAEILSVYKGPEGQPFIDVGNDDD